MMNEDYVENKLEEALQLLAANNELLEKQTALLSRIADCLDKS